VTAVELIALVAASTVSVASAPLASPTTSSTASSSASAPVAPSWDVPTAALHDIQMLPHPSETTTIAAIWGTGPSPEWDLPIDEHPSIDKWVRHFEGRGKRRFTRWLQRTTRWAPLYYEVLDDYGMPKDLLFLSMVESGLSMRAYSWAHAAGLWQFMPRTARRMGLTVDFWVDERRDFVSASHGAARYLRLLYKEFGDWRLAMAAYNAGEARVRRAIRRAGTRDFWRLERSRHLPRETRRYVPKILAAAKVAKNLEAHGISVEGFEPPVTWEVVTVTVSTDLATIAKACDLPEQTIVEYNRALYRRVTPPGRAFELKVPRWKAEGCQAGLQRIDPEGRWSYRYHAIAADDDASRVAEKFQTTATAILAHNRIDESKLRQFEAMVVPIPYRVRAAIPIEDPSSDWIRSPPYTPDSPAVRIHRVRRGESLWRIANRYRVSIRNLRAWNGLWRTNFLRIGQRLVIRGRGG